MRSPPRGSRRVSPAWTSPRCARESGRVRPACGPSCATAIASSSTASSRPTPRTCAAAARRLGLLLDLETGLDPVAALADHAVQSDLVFRPADGEHQVLVGAEVVG